MSADHFEKEARAAVGVALLHRASSNGGSYGGPDFAMDKSRAERAAGELSGEQLYDLLLETARIAVKRADGEAQHQHSRIVHEVRQLAEATDSLTLYCFIEREDAA